MEESSDDEELPPTLPRKEEIPETALEKKISQLVDVITTQNREKEEDTMHINAFGVEEKIKVRPNDLLKI